MAGKEVAAAALEELIARQPGLELAGEPPVLYASPLAVPATARELKNSPAFLLDHLCSLTAVDYPDCMEVVYHLYSHALRHALVLKVRLKKEGAALPQTPSVVAVWPTADFQEREAYDLAGVSFSGHPDLRRILLPDDFCGHPLRKDFNLPSQREKGVIPC